MEQEKNQGHSSKTFKVQSDPSGVEKSPIMYFNLGSSDCPEAVGVISFNITYGTSETRDMLTP